MAVLSRLQPAAQDRGRYRRFVHGDAQPSNVLVVGGHYSAIIDWDYAGWSGPCRGPALRTSAGGGQRPGGVQVSHANGRGRHR
jgi:hypothetical protein